VTPHSATSAPALDGRSLRVSLLSGVLLATAALYWPTTLSLIRTWNAFGSRFYTHGDLVVVLAVVALLRRRTLLARVAPVPSLGVAVLLLPLSIIWMTLYLSTFQIAHQVCLPVLLLAAVYAVCGREYARLCWFPILYLYFAIPVWQWTIPWLQRLTVAVMHAALPLAAIPTYIEGNVVQIPAGVFEIQGGCAGSAYLVVALAVAAYYADAQHTSARGGALLLAFAALCAIVGNWVRVFVIIVAGQLTAMQSYLVRVSHDEFGWAVFCISMVVFVTLAPRLARGIGAARLRQVPEPDERWAQTTGRFGPAFAAGIAFVALAVGPAWAQIVLHKNPEPSHQDVVLEGSQSWSGPFPYGGRWRPVVAGADAMRLGIYRAAGEDVALFIALFREQSQTSKLQRATDTILEPSTLVAERGVDGKADQDVRELELRDADGQSSVLLTAYAIGDHATSSVYSAQLRYAVESLRSIPPSCVIAVRAECTPDCGGARARASRFLRDNRWVLACGRLAGTEAGVR
jgi:exosortase